MAVVRKPGRGWQRPWLVDDDLKSDIAIELGCPQRGSPDKVLVNFQVQQIRAFMSGKNRTGQSGHLVVQDGLIRDLARTMGEYGLKNGKDPDAISHMSHPFHWFVPHWIKTFRMMDPTNDPSDKLQIPAPVEVLVFLAIPRRFSLDPRRNNESH